MLILRQDVLYQYAVALIHGGFFGHEHLPCGDAIRPVILVYLKQF